MNNTHINPMKYYIIDAIGPFFHGMKKDVINWSKIPFDYLESESGVDKAKFKHVRADFDKFTSTVSQIGYNAISIDDLAHLVPMAIYPKKLNTKIRQYQKHFAKLFKLAKAKGLKIFINTDLMFFNPAIEKQTMKKDSQIIQLLQQILHILFQTFEIEGVIFRIGETDGVDVTGDFLSQLSIKTPHQANRYIRELLPVFEKYDKMMVFRTWTVGVYKIGDLIWNPKTYEEAFRGINSTHFIVSMKFGSTDFFDDLDLNNLFFHPNHQKILELQTRREREGFGELPYFVGWQYEKYRQALEKANNLVGISVWCQTGGWSRWANITFLKKSTIWNELNTIATLQIFKQKKSAEAILADFFPDKKHIRFLKTGHKLLHDILYIKGFSDKTLYFRRTRIPPLLWIHWDHVIISPLIFTILNVTGKQKFIIPKKELKKFYKLGKNLHISNIDFIYDSLYLLAVCRRIFSKEVIKNKYLKKFKKYRKNYYWGYKLNIKLSEKNYRWDKIIYKILLRNQSRYRIIDKILIHPLFSIILRIIMRNQIKKMPDFVNKQAMSIEMLLK